MSTEKNIPEKIRLHPRNKNRERYDLEALLLAVPELEEYIAPSKSGEDSVDFANPLAVKFLNKALLSHYYGIKNWDFPEDNLVPPIPGRADYLHYIADLLSQSNFGTVPTGNKIKVLDVGVGANCIYPILGVVEYDWNFVGSDISSESLEAAQKIVASNPELENKIEFKIQEDSKSVFEGIIQPDDQFDFTLCNPPFHSSTEEAKKGTHRKVQSLAKKKIKTPELNFGGISSELVCEGGEHTFIHNMIEESRMFSKNCYWFSTLVSKKSNLKGIYKSLSMMEAIQVKTIPIGTGNKSSRIIAWSFLNKEEQKLWRESRWKAESED